MSGKNRVIVAVFALGAVVAAYALWPKGPKIVRQSSRAVTQRAEGVHKPITPKAPVTEDRALGIAVRHLEKRKLPVYKDFSVRVDDKEGSWSFWFSGDYPDADSLVVVYSTGKSEILWPKS